MASKEFRRMFRDERASELLASPGQTFDPLLAHGVEIGGVSVRFLAGNEVRRWVFQPAIILAEIWQDNNSQLAQFTQLKQPLHRRVLGSVVNAGHGASKARDEKLTRWIVAQSIASPAADDGIDGLHVETDRRIAVRPEGRKPQIVVYAPVGEAHSLDPPRSIALVERQIFVERRKEFRICRRGRDGLGE